MIKIFIGILLLTIFFVLFKKSFEELYFFNEFDLICNRGNENGKVSKAKYNRLHQSYVWLLIIIEYQKTIWDIFGWY